MSRAGDERLARLPAAGAVLAAWLALAGTAMAQAGFDREWHWNVGPTSGGLSMSFNDGNTPAHCWFELGTNADLSGAGTVGDMREREGYGGLQCHASLSGLKPDTAYYYRGHVRTMGGANLTGPIQSFRTQSMAATRKPECHFEGNKMMVQGYQLNFNCNGFGTAGQMSIKAGTKPDMSDAQVKGGGGLIAGPTAQHLETTLRYADFPDNTVVHFRAEVDTPSGHGQSQVGSVTMKRMSY